MQVDPDFNVKPANSCENTTGHQVQPTMHKQVDMAGEHPINAAMSAYFCHAALMLFWALTEHCISLTLTSVDAC